MSSSADSSEEAAMRNIDRLTLVYSARSGLWASIVDSARKAFDLNACTLCTITHGLAGAKEEWRTCTVGLNVPIDYLHSDELKGELGELASARLPCVIAHAGSDLYVLVEPDALAECAGSVSALDRALRSSAQAAGLAFPG
jgi:hypothetical protein